MLQYYDDGKKFIVAFPRLVRIIIKDLNVYAHSIDVSMYT